MSDPIKKLVEQSSIFLHQFAAYTYSNIPYSLRTGEQYRETRSLLQKTQYWSKKRLLALQMQELSNLLSHAYENVPYYRHLFDERGLKPRDIQNFSDLTNIPFLTKDIVRNNLADLKARNMPERTFEIATTGGSSGTPMAFYYQRRFSTPREKAFIASLWERVGFRVGKDKRMVLRGAIVDNPNGVQYKPTQREFICSTYQMEEEHLSTYYQLLKAKRLRWIHGHVSSVVTFAQYLLERGLSHHLDAVLGASEKVFPFQRRLVAEVFETRLFSWYGQSEQVVLAGECEYSSDYHIFPEYGFTELIDETGNRIVSPGISGEIVGTGFNNYGMPFIRYRTGDIGKYSQKTCECGREYDLLEEVEGRSYEYIWTKDGRAISLTGLIFGQHFNAFEHIKRIQLFQERQGHLEIRIERSSSFTSRDEDEIRNTIQRAVKYGLELNFNYDCDIQLTESGKSKFLIQKINTLLSSHQ